MSVIEVIFGTAYLSIALLLALGMVVFFAILLHLEKDHGHWAQIAIVPTIAMGITAATLFSGRSLQNVAFDLNLAVGGGIAEGGTTLLRIFTLTLLGLCTARIAGQWVRKINSPLQQGGTGLFVAVAAVFVSHNILSSIFGTQPVFIHNLLYPIFVFAALYAARGEPLVPVITAAKFSLYAMMLISLLLALVKPDMALQPDYKGWIPGISMRLWGVGSNANSIGPLALLALLLEYMQPTKQWAVRWIAIAMTLVVFLLAQSKTVWFVGVLLLIPVLAWYRVPRKGHGIDMRLALAIVLLVSAALFTLLVVDPVSIWDKVSSTGAGSDVTTLTGRSQIWAVAIEEWSRNRLFGYGPDIWGPAYRQRIGMQFSFSAHNQFLQSLSAAGVIGLLALLTYLWMLGLAAYRGAPKSRGVSLALFLMILTRCVTETPLVLSTLFNGDFLTHILLFSICLRSTSTTLSISCKPSADLRGHGRDASYNLTT